MLDRTRMRMAERAWHALLDDGGWRHVMRLDHIKEVCRYRVDEHAWRGHEAAMNRYSFKLPSTDVAHLHFVHEKGNGFAAMPLIISHGGLRLTPDCPEIIEP